jgi:hypothetical protein
MPFKIRNGTLSNSEETLCTTCRLSTIVRGRTLGEEIVQCHALSHRAAMVTFKVKSCSSYSDARQPSVMQMLEHAWILQPGSKKRSPGFVRSRDMEQEELADIMVAVHSRERD